MVKLSVWHQTLLGEDIFLGQVHLSLSWLDPGKEYEAWYALTPRREEPPVAAGGAMGSMRLTVAYHEDCIHPAAVYEPLRILLEESIHEQVRRTVCVWVGVWLGRGCKVLLALLNTILIVPHHNQSWLSPAETEFAY